MLPKMRYRLGLDIGVTSIGWCMVRLNTHDEPIAVIRAGVRIFPDGRNPKDGSSLAVTRRQARQMRRRRDRLLKRKTRLVQALTAHGFFPDNKAERKALVNLDPYALRKKGLHAPLTGAEFARALFHINLRRGFLSNRKTDPKDTESGLMRKAINDLYQRLQEEDCQTLGEWLAKRHTQGLSVRARLRGKTQRDKAYDYYADRAMIEQEFDTLWTRQSEFNPGLFTEAARAELKDILLYQRPLKPVKPGRCTLLPEEERAPLALPSSQRFRIYQEANNLRLLSQNLTEQPLTLDQRDHVVSLLEKGNATFSALRKALKLPSHTQFNLEDIKRDRLQGNHTSIILSKNEHFGPLWSEFGLAVQDEIVDKLLNEASESAIVAWLQQRTGVDEAAAERIAKAQLREGYGNLGRTALARIIPELTKNVVPYSTAVVLAGFESHSALSHAEQTGEVMAALPYYGEPLQRHVGFGTGNPADVPEIRFGRIANPTVHIGLNELRKVVNALIRRYGHPSEVIVEVARDLKQSREQKLNIQKKQSRRQDLNADYVKEACRALGRDPATLDKAKRRELSQKIQLWVELNPNDPANRRCPYTGETMSITRLLSSEVEIEHILPFAMTLDDSLNNKTVALRRANRDKGNLTPYEAFGKQLVSGYDYEAILKRATLMPRAKAMRFAPDGHAQWLRDHKDFLARALNDTAYLARIAKEYLSLICPSNKVRAIPGRLTAMLRGTFGLNFLLSGTNTKNRDDHRHHAIDAGVVAVTDQGLLQRFATASARAREQQLSRLVEEMPLPWPSYREHMARAIGNITVSFKPDHGYQGAMHEGTAWGITDDGRGTQRVRQENGLRKREYKNRTLIAISSTQDPNRHGRNESGQPKPYKGYVGGNNYCIEIWRDEHNKWNGDVISTFQAYQTIRAHGERDGLAQLRNPLLSQSGAPLVMRLMINDLVRLKVDDTQATMRVVKISGNGQIFFAPHHEANVDARNKDKENAFNYISKVAGTLQKASGRRIAVSEIGDLRDPGFRG